MISFSLSRINDNAPYDVWQHRNEFRFCTESGIHYNISFEEDEPIGGCGTYQFIIGRQEHSHSGHDSKVRATILSILDEFFVSNLNVLLYICDTYDGREGMRNRLFLSWFSEYTQSDRFTIRTADTQIENEHIYAAIIVENRNPYIGSILEEFDDYSQTLEDKP